MVLILTMLIVPAHATAGEPWSDAERGLFALNLGVTFLDYKQTIQIARDGPATGWRVYETNPIIGSHPSEEWVTLYFAGMVVAQYYIADLLKPEYRKLFLVASILIESALVKQNLRLGLRW